MRSLIALFCIAFIVEAQQNPRCLKDWSYFAKSNKCFKMFGGEFDAVRPTTWSQAEAYCNTFHGGHLASFHLEEEVTFVVGLSQQVLWDDGHAGSVHIGHSYTENYQWEWTDGSPWTFTRWWRPDILDSGTNWQAQNPRGVLFTKRYWTGTYWAGDNNEQKAFACQMPPSSEG